MAELLDEVRGIIRAKHYSYRTEEAARSICRTLWNENIKTRTGNLAGNICFPPDNAHAIRAPASPVAITFPKAPRK